MEYSIQSQNTCSSDESQPRSLAGRPHQLEGDGSTGSQDISVWMRIGELGDSPADALPNVSNLARNRQGDDTAWLNSDCERLLNIL